MKSTRVDKAMVIWLAAALLLWTVCLVVLWADATDASGRATLVSVAATLLALVVAVQLPGRLVRLVQRLAVHLNARAALAISLASRGPDRARPQEALGIMRTLGFVVVFAAACGAVSTGAIRLVGPVADAAASAMLFTPLAWTVFTLVLQTVAMLPMALALATTFLAAGMLRVGSGRDVYATVFREWLWALAVAMGAAALAWRLGANLQALSASTAAALLAGALALLHRRRAAMAPPPGDRPIETASTLRRGGVAVTFAIAAAALLLQLRLAGDVLHLPAPAALAWIGASAALLAGFLRRIDRKTRPPGQRQRIGATLGVLAGLLMQAAMLTAAYAGGAVAVVCCVIAAVAQVPVAALAAIVLSRQRRLFAEAGGRARSYLGAAALGAATCVLVSLAAMSVHYGPRIALGAALAAALAATVASIALARGVRDQLAWAATGAALLCALAGGMLAAGQVARPARLRAGVWLTALSHPHYRPPGPLGALPDPPTWRSDGVARALATVMAGQQGNWLIATASCLDLPGEPDPGVHVTLSAPAAVLVPGEACGLTAIAREGDLFAAGHLGRRRYDGILLSLLPAGHAAAWRCYNDRTLRAQLRRLQGGGLAAMRIQARGRDAAAALAAIRTFCDAVGDCWLVVDGCDAQADLLVVGPAERMNRPPGGDGVIVLPARRLWYEWPDVRAIRLASPGAVGRGLSAGTLLGRLRAAGRSAP